MSTRSSVPRGFRKTFTLAGQRWRVEYRDKVVDEEGTELLGQCRTDYHRIQVSTDQSRQRMINTFLHEAMHAALSDAPGFSDSDGHETFADGDKLEEAVVVAVTTAFLDLMSSNKWIRQLLA